MYDVKMYVYGFYEINYGNATIYVCTTNVCYVYAFIDSNIATRDVCMYVCMQVWMRYCIFMILPNLTLQRDIMFSANGTASDVFFFSITVKMEIKIW